MQKSEARRALAAAVDAAQAAGQLMRRNWRSPKRIASESQHDIKLELDVRCQKLIERRLQRAFPDSAILGEEGIHGDPAARLRWVIDPIDGTVNFTYGIPHACVSIALQETGRAAKGKPPEPVTMVGVVLDPFCEELWTAVRGGPARLNGRRIQVSGRRRLTEAIVSLGFGKQQAVLEHMLPACAELAHRVRKIRIMGAAALALTYVASGRFDAYVEAGLRIWDIEAGGLIVECAGGRFWRRQMPGEHFFEVNASNGPAGKALERFTRLKPNEKH
jgi:myo-inositol-1(or 4)-monophosphatase